MQQDYDVCRPERNASAMPPPRKKPELPLSPQAAALKPAKGKAAAVPPVAKVEETGGPKGAEPTRYGDWEKKGRCSDF